MKNIILTGDRPTGNLHLGHYVGSLKKRVELQNQGDFDKFYIMVADTQALTDNADNVDKVKNNLIQVVIDYISAGIDPEKATIFVQSMVPELAEMTTICLTLILVIIVAKLLGAVLPIVAKKFGLDPAVMASPLVTTILDAVSLLIYFGIAAVLVL